MPNAIPLERPVALFALVMLLAVLVSALTRVPGSSLFALWLPTSLVLVGLLSRGHSVLVPALAGLSLGLWLVGVGAAHLAGIALAAIVAPLCAATIIERLRAATSTHSRMARTVQLFVAIVFVQAPLAAAFQAAGGTGQPDTGGSLASAFLLLWMIEAMTGVIFVRGLLACMPDGAGGFCPLHAVRDSGATADRPRKIAFAAAMAMLILAMCAIVTGSEPLARLATMLLFAVAAFASAVLGRGPASVLVMLTCFTALAVRMALGNVPLAIGEPGSLFLYGALLMVGGGLLHMLNELSEERVRQQQELHRQAFSNETSGLPNLRALTEFIAQHTGQDDHRGGAPDGFALPDAVRVGQAQHRLSLAEISLGGLSQWADLAGRSSAMAIEAEIGVRLQRAFARRLRHLSHVATGRFILVLEAGDSSDSLIESMRAVFDRQRVELNGHTVRLAWSLGVVDCPGQGFELDSALASLSIAQQQAVMHNDRFCRLTLDDDRVRAYREGLAWTQRIRQMLADDRLCLFAQPIVPVDAGSQSSLHFEILARMRDDDGRLLTPDRFLPAVAQAGLHTRFDRAVIALTLRTLAADRRLADATDMVAVNVTGPSICDPQFPAFLFASLKHHRIDAHKLTIEITESDSIADLDLAIENASALRAAGVRVAVDDFGTGQATFDYIRRLRPDLLKIDGAFVKRHADSPIDREIVASIVRLGHAVGARLVAEFVESPEIVAQMRAIGVDYVQGWAIARPMPIAQIRDWQQASMRGGHADYAAQAGASAVVSSGRLRRLHIVAEAPD